MTRSPQRALIACSSGSSRSWSVAGEEDLTDTVGFQQARLEQLIFEHRLLEELFLLRAVAVHEPVVVAVDVGDDIRIVVQHAEQIAGDIAIQVVAEDQLAVGIVHPRAVGGDHIRADLQVIADLPHVDMVAAGGKHEIHAALASAALAFLSRKATGCGREKAACHLNQKQQPGT